MKNLKRLAQRGGGDVVMWILSGVAVVAVLTWDLIPFWLRHVLIGAVCAAAILAGSVAFAAVVVMGAYKEATYGRKMIEEEEKAAVWYGSIYTAIVFSAGMFAYVHWARLTKFFDA